MTAYRDVEYACRLPAALRRVLYAICLFALPLGCAESEHSKAIKALGGVHEVDSLLGINDVTFSGPDFTDKHLLEAIVHLNELRVDCVYLFDTSVSVQGVDSLRELNNLRTIGLGGKEVTDKHVERLTTFPALTCVDLRNASLTDSGVGLLNRLPKLSMLNLANTDVTDKALANIATFTSLRVLGLEGTHVTDKGIERLANMPKLEYISLWDTHVSKKTAEGLKLSLSGCSIVTEPPASLRR